MGHLCRDSSHAAQWRRHHRQYLVFRRQSRPAARSPLRRFESGHEPLHGAAVDGCRGGVGNALAGSNSNVALINPGPIDTEIWLREDEPVAYHGPKYPPEIVTAAIFEAIEKRRHEMTVPKRNLQLVTARVL